MLNNENLELICKTNEENNNKIIINLGTNFFENLLKYVPKEEKIKLFKPEKEIIKNDKKEENKSKKKIKIDDNLEEKIPEIEEEEIINNQKIKIILTELIDYTKKNDSLIAKQWINYFIKSKEYQDFLPQSKNYNFVYKQINASGTFVPLLQTFYESDAKKISESTKTTPLSITYKDMKERVRVSVINGNYGVNYFDPEIQERFKIWSLFTFNFNLTTFHYHNFST
ncbi:MAG: hypothetical protein ACMXX8_03995 [Candidatus Woesearchaeota archaeon]